MPGKRREFKTTGTVLNYQTRKYGYTSNVIMVTALCSRPTTITVYQAQACVDRSLISASISHHPYALLFGMSQIERYTKHSRTLIIDMNPWRLTNMGLEWVRVTAARFVQDRLYPFLACLPAKKIP
jgi:hypothetical protein